MNYQRVIPRDLFNEAKLLSCLGHLIIAIDDGRVNGLKLGVEFDGESFDIQQNPDDGSIYCANFELSLAGEPIFLYCPLNARSRYPIIARYRDEDYHLFDDNGAFMPNFGVDGRDTSGAI